MEGAITTLAKVFVKSSKGKENLGKKEFQSLVRGQLSNILSEADSKEAVDNMGKGLDADSDGKVGFEEYLKLVGYLAVSLSEQRTLNKEPAQNAVSEQVRQAAVDKDEAKPEANAEAKPEGNTEAKEEAKPEATEESKAEAAAEVKIEANADPKLELKVDANAGPMVEVKTEGVTVPEAAKEEEKTAAAAVAAAVEAATTVVDDAAKEAEKKAEVTVEEVVEKVAEAVEEAEKKPEEATS